MFELGYESIGQSLSYVDHNAAIQVVYLFYYIWGVVFHYLHYGVHALVTETYLYSSVFYFFYGLGGLYDRPCGIALGRYQTGYT